MGLRGAKNGAGSILTTDLNSATTKTALNAV